MSPSGIMDLFGRGVEERRTRLREARSPRTSLDHIGKGASVSPKIPGATG